MKKKKLMHKSNYSYLIKHNCHDFYVEKFSWKYYFTIERLFKFENHKSMHKSVQILYYRGVQKCCSTVSEISWYGKVAKCKFNNWYFTCM